MSAWSYLSNVYSNVTRDARGLFYFNGISHFIVGLIVINAPDKWINWIDTSHPISLDKDGKFFSPLWGSLMCSMSWMTVTMASLPGDHKYKQLLGMQWFLWHSYIALMFGKDIFIDSKEIKEREKSLAVTMIGHGLMAIGYFIYLRSFDVKVSILYSMAN